MYIKCQEVNILSWGRHHVHASCTCIMHKKLKVISASWPFDSCLLNTLLWNRTQVWFEFPAEIPIVHEFLMNMLQENVKIKKIYWGVFTCKVGILGHFWPKYSQKLNFWEFSTRFILLVTKMIFDSNCSEISCKI